MLNVRTIAGSENSSKVLALAGCRPEGCENEVLVITLDDRIITFDGSGTKDVNITISVRNGFWWYVEKMLTHFRLRMAGGKDKYYHTEENSAVQADSHDPARFADTCACISYQLLLLIWRIIPTRPKRS